jgi:hypothetical protein
MQLRSDAFNSNLATPVVPDDPARREGPKHPRMPPLATPTLPSKPGPRIGVSIQVASSSKLILLLWCLLFLCACKSTEKKSDEHAEAKPTHKEKKLAAILQIYLENRNDLPEHQQNVSVIRSSPVQLKIQKSPFATEAFLDEAQVIDTRADFVIMLKFDHHGRLTLEQYSSLNLGRRFVIFSQFGEGLHESRWLAAPVIQKRITDGVLTFTPDATREEAEQLVKGLNNVAEKAKKGYFGKDNE